MATPVTLTRQTLNQLLPERSPEEWIAIRDDLLRRGYASCSVSGCSGLVSPQFQREIPGLGLVSLCPRVQVHAQRLGPARHAALLAAFRAAATQADAEEPRPEPTADVKILDLGAKRNERKPVEA